jgi:hypothetical protein
MLRSHSLSRRSARFAVIARLRPQGTARALDGIMARFLRLAFATLSAVGLSTLAGSALADAAAGAQFVGCQVAIGTNGMSLPSNAPALLVNDTSNQATATVSAELVTADTRAPFGAPTKDTHGLLVVTLPTASVGAHTIATKVACSNGTPESVQETTLALTVPVDFPTSVGTLSVRPGPAPSPGVERLALEASPGLQAFKPVVVVELSVNGVVTSGSQRGGFAEELSVNTGAVCVENGALHREKRTVHVSLAAHLAGVAESPAAATLDIPVDCGAIHWTTDADFDGSTSTVPSTSTPGSNNGTGGSSASGCSAAPSGRASGGSAIFAAATALALLASFRRRRHLRTR